jgi:hypothetical protein
MLPLAKKYQPPRCRIGGGLKCAIRGPVRVDCLSASPIPWPCCRVGQAGGRPAPIVTGDLVEAVRVEAVQSVAHHWGVSRWTVSRWRRKLGVPRFNAGTQTVWRMIAKTKLAAARKRLSQSQPGARRKKAGSGTAKKAR